MKYNHAKPMSSSVRLLCVSVYDGGTGVHATVYNSSRAFCSIPIVIGKSIRAWQAMLAATDLMLWMLSPRSAANAARACSSAVKPASAPSSPYRVNTGLPAVDISSTLEAHLWCCAVSMPKHSVVAEEQDRKVNRAT